MTFPPASPLSPPTSSRVALVAAVAVVLALGACTAPRTAELDGTSAPTGSPAPTSQPADAAAPAPAPGAEPEGIPTFEPYIALYRTDGTGEFRLEDVTVTAHEGFTRLEYVLDGSGQPSYDVSWVDKALDEETERVLPIEGDAVLRVAVGPVPASGGEMTPDPPAGTGVVRSVLAPVRSRDALVTFVGATSPVPVRAFWWAEGHRLVVDLLDEA